MATESTPPPSHSLKTKLVALCAVLAIVTSGLWIYLTQFRSPELNVSLHQAVGQVMAEETVKIVGHVGKIVLISMDPAHAPELKVQISAFEKHLKLLGGITVQERIVLDPGDNPKFRPGSGLSAKRFLKIARKHQGVDALVSFVGAPQVEETDLAQLKTPPKFIAETRSPERSMVLLDKKILLAAIVPRFEFPAPGPRKPGTSRQWFDRYFQVVSPGAPPPKPDELP
jgi:hypothetical protein